MRRVIGIDFGTSTTYMNVKRYNGEQPDGDIYSYSPGAANSPVAAVKNTGCIHVLSLQAILALSKRRRNEL